MPHGLSRRRLLTAASVLAVGVALHAPALQAQEVLQFAHVYEANEPYHTWAEWAAEQIEERTDGRYTIEVFPASQLGSEAEINEGLALGTVDIIYSGALFSSRSFGPIAISEAPYMLDDFEHWQAYIDSDLFQDHIAGYRDATGHEVLAGTYYGERHVTANRRVEQPEDMEGLRIRVPDAPLYTLFPRVTGAAPTPIAFAEVYLALQQGVVDAQENPLPTIHAKSFYEVQDYINLTGHITNTLLTVVSGPVWNGLSEEDREIFAEVLKEAAANCTEEVHRLEAELRQTFEEMDGTEVVEVDRQPFMDILKEHHLGDAATWTEEDYERLQALADK
jgi:tripartite ATP-independent transporter DctP family solute receptor